MKKKEQSFIDFFLSAARTSGAALPVRLLFAVILAAVSAALYRDPARDPADGAAGLHDRARGL